MLGHIRLTKLIESCFFFNVFCTAVRSERNIETFSPVKRKYRVDFFLILTCLYAMVATGVGILASLLV